MSKKSTPNSTPTLFKYFKKVEPPKLSSSTTTTVNDVPEKTSSVSDEPLHESPTKSESEPDDSLGDNGSEDEYIPSKQQESESSDSEDSPPATPPSSSEGEVTPVKNRNKRGHSGKSAQPRKKVKVATTPSTPRVIPSQTTPSTPRVLVPPSAPSTPTFLASSDASELSTTSGGGTQDWLHHHFKFLHPDHIMDADRRRPNHPDYNPKTLFVPPDFLSKQTPCMTQWWVIKSQNFDCVLFFKVGKFYELFHMDAEIGADELACSYMKNEYAHSGFPEISYGKFAQTLVEKGYKVARIEQTETPDQLDVRAKRDKLPGKQRVVRREVCKITCRGAQTFSIMDVDANYTENKFLLGVTREGNNIGVCFVDTTIGEFHVGQFEDDKQYSRLSTLMSHYPPSRILLEKSLWNNSDLKIFLNVVRLSDLEFISGKKDILSEDKILSALSPQEHEAAKPLLSGELRTGKLSSTRLDTKSFGAVHWFLKRCLINEQLVTLGKFKQYIPVDEETQVQSERDSGYQYPKYMVLDSTALFNLHVLVNSENGRQGTLLEQLDHCVTPFGKRMLHAQLVKPLTNVEAIRRRQEAICVLLENRAELDNMRAKMKDMKDLERMLPRIYSLTSAAVPPSHPESRATLYENKTYSTKKIEMFTRVLRDMEVGKKIMEHLQISGITRSSALLAQLCNYDSHSTPGCFPDITELLDYFAKSFDHKEASKTGNIIPQPGMVEEYDEVMAEIKQIEKTSADYLKEQSAHFRCPVIYNEAQRKQKKFVLEVPSRGAGRANSSYTKIVTKKKTVENYTTSDTKMFQENLEKAEAKRTSVLGNMTDKILRKFCENNEVWTAAVYCLATMDFLGSLTEYCHKEANLCVPNFVLPKESHPYVSAVESFYPSATPGQTFIPNTIVIGRTKEENMESDGKEEEKRPTVLLLTGPNMGGKSTVMRQIGLITIMAQIGCRVPAESLTLTPVDRIFTRMGAKDNLSGAQSTYHAELTESEMIMKHATKFSLALVDELGRGTSTNDGCVIARVTLERFLQIGCLTIFATHYHSVAHRLQDNPSVAFEYMSYLEDKRNSGVDTIVFLYKLVQGICPKSFGFNVAELARIEEHVVQYGTLAAFQMEVREKLRQIFLHKFVPLIASGEDTQVDDLKNCLDSLSLFENETTREVQTMNVRPEKKVLNVDWWPTRVNDPCSYEMAVKPIEELLKRERQFMDVEASATA